MRSASSKKDSPVSVSSRISRAEGVSATLSIFAAWMASACA